MYSLGEDSSFEIRRKEALSDIYKEQVRALAVMKQATNCRDVVDRERAIEALGAGAFSWVSLGWGSDEAEKARRVAACERRLAQAKGEAAVLNLRLQFLFMKVSVAQNDSQLEAAYADLPVSTLKPLVLGRIDRALSAFADQDRGFSFARRIYPNLAEPLAALKVKLEQYRTQANAATSSAQLMRILAQLQSEARAAVNTTFERAGDVVAGGAVGMGAAAAPAVIHHVAEQVGEGVGGIVGAAASGALSAIWNIAKPILLIAAVAAVGWIGFKQLRKRSA